MRAIVELAKGYGIDTVAEQVENREIAEFLRKFGVDHAQGYAFSKPEPLTEVLKNSRMKNRTRFMSYSLICKVRLPGSTAQKFVRSNL